MNRREFARNIVGAIVGVSVVPEFGKKPSPLWHRKVIMVESPKLWPPILELLQFYPPSDFSKWRPYLMKDHA